MSDGGKGMCHQIRNLSNRGMICTTHLTIFSSVHRFTWHRDILPRYVDGNLALHLHIALKGGLFFCREISWDRDVSGFSHEVIEGPRTQLDGHLVKLTCGEQQCAVFVAVYECLEPQQRFISSIMRLHPFEFRNRMCGNFALRKTIKTVVFERFLVGVVEDRKCRESLIPRSLIDIKRRVEKPRCKFPHEVIERRSSIGDAIANDDGQSGR